MSVASPLPAIALAPDTGPAAALRAARALIGLSCATAEQRHVLGTITLRLPQRNALSRVTALLETAGGCLLADDVGRGKTYVALAAARRWTRTLIVIPASLGDEWRAAMRRAGVAHDVVTHESLSRGTRPRGEWDGIIVDESHHFRNMATRRHGRLADIASYAELVLLSATPVQNAARDLAAQLALFLGSAVFALSDAERARFVVRVEADDAATGMPSVRSPRWVSIAVDDSRVLDAIVRLPTPPRALDAGDAGALRTLSLVRAWASSHAALRAAIKKRTCTALAIEQSLDARRLPTRAELRSWRTGSFDTVQLGFAGLLVEHDVGLADEVVWSALRRVVKIELSALATLGHLVDRAAGVDDARARALATIADAHPGERVLAFTQLASTARSYFRLLRQRASVALLTASGGEIVSGRVTRREILARFAPVAQGVPAPPARERIALLISTDLLSEGVNLQDASVVVHLDLPWNPARLAQRVGRIRRPFGASAVASFLLGPPASTEHLAAVETRLRHKLAEATRTVGRAFDVVPTLTANGLAAPSSATAGHVELRARVDARLSRWADDAPSSRSPPFHPVVAAAIAPHDGWLALTAEGRLVAACSSPVGSDSALLDRATQLAEGMAALPDPASVTGAFAALEAHRQREQALADCGMALAPSGMALAPSGMARTVRRHVSAAVFAAPRHLRAPSLRLSAAIDAALEQRLSLGAERLVLRLATQGDRGALVQWLTDVLGALPARARSRTACASAPGSQVLIVFQTGSRVAADT